MRSTHVQGGSSYGRLARLLLTPLGVALAWACGGSGSTTVGEATGQSTESTTGAGQGGGAGGEGGSTSVSGGNGGSQGGLDALVKKTVEEHAKSLVTDGTPSPTKAPGGIVGVYINTRKYYFPYGKVDEDKQPPTEHTIFGIGSLTKVLTTSILGQHPEFLQQGVAQYLPSGIQLQPQESGLTFEQLATYSGGIPAMDPACNQQAFEDFISQVTPPGGTLPAKAIESNASIGLLGQVMMSMEGSMTFGTSTTMKWYTNRLFAGIGMSHTMAPPLPDAQHPLANVYAWNASINDYENIGFPSWCPWGTADRMFSTADDLMKFIIASVGVHIIDGLVVPPLILEGMKEALTPRTDAVNKEDNQALAWKVFPADPTYGSRVRGQAGGLDGVSAYMAVNPELAYGVVVLLNMQGAPAEQVALDIMAELLPAAGEGLN